MSEAVLVERRERVMIVTLNRPESRNAVNRAVTVGVGEALEEADRNPDVWAVIITGAGDREFVSGGDLKLAPGQKPDVRRVLGLFRPYRGTLAAVLSLIVLAAAAGVVSPFLIREIVDVALPEQRADVLAWSVGGLIAVTVVASGDPR